LFPSPVAIRAEQKAVGARPAGDRDIIREDPFHEHGLADFRIIEFRASQRADDISKRIADA
jgi:hypothetical protein